MGESLIFSDSSHMIHFPSVGFMQTGLISPKLRMKLMDHRREKMVYSGRAEVTFCLRCYQPTDKRLDSFLLFLKDKGVRLDEVEIRKANEDAENNGDGKSSGDDSVEDAASELLQPDNIPSMV
ncbi:hypothetical protein ACET3Z_011039 [Daucus carota]